MRRAISLVRSLSLRPMAAPNWEQGGAAVGVKVAMNRGTAFPCGSRCEDLVDSAIKPQGCNHAYPAGRQGACSHGCAIACNQGPHLHGKVCKAHGVGVPHCNLAARLVGHVHLGGRVQEAMGGGRSG